MAADPKRVLSDEEILAIRREVTDFHHGIENTPNILAFARRVEAMVLERAAERLRYTDEMLRTGTDSPDYSCDCGVPAGYIHTGACRRWRDPNMQYHP